MKRLFLLNLLLINFLNLMGQVSDKYIDERDGNVYKTVTIGGQVWFAENIAFETKKGSWVYDKNVKNLPLYGRLYNWKTACEVCPSGWRLPSLDDYKALLKNINVADSLLYYETLIEGGKSGFNVKLAGLRSGWRYGRLNEHANFWTSTIYQPFKGATINAYRFSFYKVEKSVYLGPYYKDEGFSVRCIKE